jgi:hypothetical protein
MLWIIQIFICLVFALSEWVRVRVSMFNATFNNISVISWRSILFVKETRVPGVNHCPAASQWNTLSHNVLSSWTGLEHTYLVVIGTVCIGSCENYHTITSTTTPYLNDINIDIYVDFLQVPFLMIISLKNEWKFKPWLTRPLIFTNNISLLIAFAL